MESVFYGFETQKIYTMTKDEILEQMRIEMPFHLPDRIRPYIIEEAMEIYAQQQVENCSIAVVSDSLPSKVRHVCGAQGYNPMLGDICEACSNER